ncbi:MAG: multiple antibiotic resistance protein [Bacteroidetes bacterium]|nr:MAG: multiple antibiotic resistance protein [Bacteroidota bacterium]
MENIWGFSITVFMAFFAIMNPVVNIPIFVKLTGGVDAKGKKRIAKTSNLVALIIVTAFILVGKYIFEIFGLTIPAFKVFGGILIFFIGFEMLQSKKPSIHQNEKAVFDEGIAISPLAIPVLAGPGTIVTAMNFVVGADILHVLLTIVIFALIVMLTYLAFIYSSLMINLVGQKNFVIIGKIMGLILGVLGANMLIEGIKMAFGI